jgi:hypothetical protein
MKTSLTRDELIFLAACILVRDPDGKNNLYRRDSTARVAMQVAVSVAKMMYSVCDEELDRL